ncbi:EF-hand domain-containing protein [Longispora urticae]
MIGEEIMSGFQNAKIKRYFDSLDTTGDGRITREDFDTIAERHAEANGYAAQSADARRLRDATHAFWTSNLQQLDTSGAGVVTIDQFASAIAQLSAAGVAQYDALVRPTADAYFDLCDQDGSGDLSQDEFVRIFGGAASVPAEESIATFRQIDSNGSGVVSRDEYHAALKDFYYSSDPAKAGNHLFGRVSV